MCGIAGFCGDYDLSHLSKMIATLSHRGPDHHGHIHLQSAQGPVGLGHTRLSIIDLSDLGNQPMTVQCACCQPSDLPNHQKIWLTYNGEIYNAPALRRELEALGHTFFSHSDSEIILHCYAQYGLQAFERLNGIFALALYDGRPSPGLDGVASGDLFLVRDQLGVKPLYFNTSSTGVIFASEIKALVKSGLLSRELDPVALHYYLAYMWSPAPKTPLRGVEKLPPGHIAHIRRRRVLSQWAFYDIPYGEYATDSADVLQAQLFETLETAISRQLLSDVPIGAFLSGGLDSSSIVAMMRRLQPDVPIDCYAIGFGNENIEGAEPDLPYARRVADHLGVNLHSLIVDADMLSRLPDLIWHLDEPQADPAPINALLIAERAHRDGLKVLMSGAGGDDIFSGYRRHIAIASERYWRWLPGLARQVLGSGARLMGGCFQGSTLVRRLSKLFQYADLPDDQRLISYFFWSSEAFRRGLYHPDFAAQLGGVMAFDPLLASLRRIPSDLPALDRMLYLESKHFLADHNLNYTDKVSMAYSIETRVPLLDPDLVRFAASVPPCFKQRGQVSKWIFKRAMEPLLPRDVIYRSKTGFGAPLRHWMRREMRPFIEAYLSPDVVASRGIFDAARIQRLLKLSALGKVDGSFTLFSCLCIELWCQRFIDGV